MERITPEQVKAAYEKTGMKPARCSMLWWKKDGAPCGCGLGALFVASHGGLDAFRDVVLMPALRPWAQERWGAKYVYGFIVGFDDNGLPCNDARKREGRADGRAAAALVFSE